MLGITYRRALLFGVGIHRWPDARASAGLWAVSKFANQHKFRWMDVQTLQADVAMSEQFPHIIIARPKTIVPSRVGEIMIRVSERYEVPFEDLFIVHHDPELEAGQFRVEEDLNPDFEPQSEILKSVLSIIQGDKMRRYVLGVGRQAGSETQGIPRMDNDEWTQRSELMSEMLKMVPEDSAKFKKAVEALSQQWGTNAFDVQKAALDRWAQYERYEQKLRKETATREKIERKAEGQRLQREMAAKTVEEERLREAVTQKLLAHIERSRQARAQQEKSPQNTVAS